MKRKPLLTLALLISTCCLVLGQERAHEQEVASILKKARVPAISLAYFENGKISTSIAYGKKRADREELVDTNTIFSAASLSKPVVAFLTMRMVEKGLIHLDSPLVEYAPYPSTEQGEWHGDVTPRMVLSHTTGLPNWSRGERTFLRKPGSKFGYSGEGFVWLQHTLTHFTGRSLQELAKEYVFDPLDMPQSTFVWNADLAGKHAYPHDKFQEVKNMWKPSQANAAASLQTTAEEYARFLMELCSPSLISSETLHMMLEEQILVKTYLDGTERVSWALGLGIQQTAMGREYWQWGDNGTFRAYFTFSPKEKRGLVYFTNSQNGLGITRDLTDLYMGTSQPGWRWNGYRPLGFWYRLQEVFH
ncbi:MAG: serine hydrolase domain-containing protein [Bacteroidota bacterium]